MRCWRREEVQESQGQGVPRSQGPRYLKVTFKYELDSKEGPSCLLNYFLVSDKTKVRMGVTVRYSNLIHPQLVESVRTHQNSTFKLVKLGKGKLLLNVYLLLNCIISSLSE